MVTNGKNKIKLNKKKVNQNQRVFFSFIGYLKEYFLIKFSQDFFSTQMSKLYKTSAILGCGFFFICRLENVLIYYNIDRYFSF